MTTFKNYENIHRMLEETVRRMPDGDAFRWFLSAGQMSVSWSEFYDQVRAAAKSLMALGVRKGDKVNILSYSCYRWVLADLAINAIGAVTVGIYQSNLAKECGHIVDHSDGIIWFSPKTKSNWKNWLRSKRGYRMFARSFFSMESLPKKTSGS